MSCPFNAGFIFLLVLVHETGQEGGGVLGDCGQVRHDGQQVQGHRQRWDIGIKRSFRFPHFRKLEIVEPKIAYEIFDIKDGILKKTQKFRHSFLKSLALYGKAFKKRIIMETFHFLEKNYIWRKNFVKIKCLNCVNICRKEILSK
jgi:hypothetical protein